MAAVNCVGGPWGGNGGVAWYYVPKGVICGVSISYGDVINTIRFSSQDEAGNYDYSGQFGNQVGGNKAEFEFDPKVKKIIGITGTVGNFGGLLVVTSLSFTTDKKTCYGPYGKANGTPFSSELLDDQIITGFYGHSDSYLDAIGVYIHPKLSVGLGVISGISITYDDAINSISFTSVDEKGIAEKSRMFGETRGSKNDEIEIDIENNEKLDNISGTIDVKDGLLGVTSLIFSTDKEKSFGPFGTLKGMAFSLRVNNGNFSGFHGRYGWWLDAIGVVAKPT